MSNDAGMDIKAQIAACKTLDEAEALYPPRQLKPGEEVVRIAPSPTGMPHIGTAMQAVIDRALADKSKGTFILRIEDTDQTRYVEGAEKAIIDSLKWLGAAPDEGPHGFGGSYGPYVQSQRLNLYRLAAERLVETGHAYYCFCSAPRLEAMRKEQTRKGEMPQYDGHCRNLSPEEIKEKIAAGEKYVIRQRIPDTGKVSFNDLVRGEIEFDLKNVDDTVLLKSDGFPTYHLAVIVDDHFMRVTTVVRGEEWISSTPKHVLLYKSFGWQCPNFLHTVLLRDEQHRKLSKRSGDTSIEWFKTQGIMPEGFRNFLTRVMWAHPGNKDIYSMEEFTRMMDPKDLPSSGPVVDMKLLAHINGCYLSQKSAAEITEGFTDYLGYLVEHDRLPGIPVDADPTLITVEKIKALLDEIKADIPYCQLVISLEPERSQKYADFIFNNSFYFETMFTLPKYEHLAKQCPEAEKISAILDQVATFYSIDHTHDEWNVGLREIAKAQGVKDKVVFMLARLGISGRDKTPPLYDVMKILGKQRVVDRLHATSRLAPPPSAA